MAMAADSVFLGVWMGRVRFLAMAALVVFIALVPSDLGKHLVPAPDLLAGLTLAVVLRRPEFVPFWLLAVVFLLADILEMRPPGLWTAIILLTAEFTRAQEYRLRELAFVFEWAFVAAVMFLALLANRVILMLTLVPQAGFGAVMMHYLVTVLSYPLVVLLCYFVLHIRKVSPNLAIRFGHRL